RTFLLATAHTAASDDDAAIGEGALLADHVRRMAPSGLDEFGCDQLPAGVGLGHDLGRCRHRCHLFWSLVIPSTAGWRGTFGVLLWLGYPAWAKQKISSGQRVTVKLLVFGSAVWRKVGR